MLQKRVGIWLAAVLAAAGLESRESSPVGAFPEVTATASVAGLQGTRASQAFDGRAIRRTIAAAPSAASASPALSLQRYRADLAAFRQEYGGFRSLPDVPFFQFGMGLRRKLLFKGGVLRDARTGVEIQRWDAKHAVTVPPEYLVRLSTGDGRAVAIREDETAVWIEENSGRVALAGTRAPLRLPDFAGHRYASILRVLHHEILINVTEAGPVPNFYVYKRAWYRDGAMMAMCLQTTGNLDTIRDWIHGLRDPFDRNNAGETEADNLGQALFLISLSADKNHPLVPKVLKELARFEVRAPGGRYIQGRSDFAEHPVYQTKWAKYGLRALQLDDPYVIPRRADSYSSLFWMDYRDRHVPGAEAADRGNYPYLGWATDHFQGRKLSPISNRDYPLTWETDASQADYAGMKVIDPAFVRQKTSAPHTWHAAEMFLYLREPIAPRAGRGAATRGSKSAHEAPNSGFVPPRPSNLRPNPALDSGGSLNRLFPPTISGVGPTRRPGLDPRRSSPCDRPARPRRRPRRRRSSGLRCDPRGAVSPVQSAVGNRSGFGNPDR
jgi:hypothetical protein